MRRGIQCLPALLLLVMACSKEPAREIGAEILFDPQILALDFAAPATRFDKLGGSLRASGGWAPAEMFRFGKTWSTVAWALEGRSELSYTHSGLLSEPLDLYLEAKPVPHPDGREQTVAVLVNGLEAGRAPIPPGWNAARVELTESLLSEGPNQLSLVFDYCLQPSAAGTSRDDRKLCALFHVVALIPRWVQDPSAFLGAHRLDAAARELTVPAGGGFALPVPPGRSGRMAFAVTAAPASGARLVVSLDAPGGVSEELWRGEAVVGPMPELDLETPAVGISRLVVQVESAASGVSKSVETVGFALPVGALRLRPPRPPSQTNRPNVFIYMVDTLRADALTVYGAERAVSPRVGAFALDAIVYLDAWAGSTWTLPSTVSLLTGVYPFHHGVMKGNVPLGPDGVPTLAARLETAGYRSFGFSQSFVAGPKFGVETGFSSFILSNQLGGWEQRSQDARRYFLDWLSTERRGDRPIFAYFHTVDPHAPYGATESGARFVEGLGGRLGPRDYLPHKFNKGEVEVNAVEVAHMRGLYDGEVEHADAEFGRFIDLLKYLDLYDDAMIALVSDHGEEFGEHGAFDHGRTVWEEMVRVPLIVKFPRGRGAGSRMVNRVSTIDVAPTVLELAGVEVSDGELDGRALVAETATPGSASRRPIFSEIAPAKGLWVGAVDYQTLAVERIKCIGNALELDQSGRPEPRWQAFDLAVDPTESNSLPPEDPRFVSCREALERWRAVAEARGEGLPDTRSLDADARDALRALGYVD